MVADNIDKAYILYMKMNKNRAPTTAQFKRFIDDEERVTVTDMDYSAVHDYLTSTGRGRSSSRDLTATIERSRTPSKRTSESKKKRASKSKGQSTYKRNKSTGNLTQPQSQNGHSLGSGRRRSRELQTSSNNSGPSPSSSSGEGPNYRHHGSATISRNPSRKRVPRSPSRPNLKRDKLGNKTTSSHSVLNIAPSSIGKKYASSSHLSTVNEQTKKRRRKSNKNLTSKLITKSPIGVSAKSNVSSNGTISNGIKSNGSSLRKRTKSPNGKRPPRSLPKTAKNEKRKSKVKLSIEAYNRKYNASLSIPVTDDEGSGESGNEMNESHDETSGAPTASSPIKSNGNHNGNHNGNMNGNHLSPRSNTGKSSTRSSHSNSPSNSNAHSNTQSSTQSGTPSVESPPKSTINIADLSTFPFTEHMTREELDTLAVNHKVDHRHKNGKYLAATIIRKNGTKLLVNYDKYGPYQTKYDEWSDYKYEIHRFAKYHSISLRPCHRMSDVVVGNSVDINPRRTRKRGHKGWRVGEVVQRDYKSGQILVEYSFKSKEYQWWTHLDNANEVSPFQSMINMDLSDFSAFSDRTDSSPSQTPTETVKDHRVNGYRNKSSPKPPKSPPKVSPSPSPERIQKHQNKTRSSATSSPIKMASNQSNGSNYVTITTPGLTEMEMINGGTLPLNSHRSGHDHEMQIEIEGIQSNGVSNGYTTHNGLSRLSRQNSQNSLNSLNTTIPPRPKLQRLDSRDVARWDTPNVVQWFNTIEHGRFAHDDEYEQLRETLHKWNVKGSDLLQITHVWLKMLVHFIIFIFYLISNLSLYFVALFTLKSSLSLLQSV